MKKKPKAVHQEAKLLDPAGNVWPLERDVFFRPDRLRYVRKLIQPVGCVFCNALEQGEGFASLVLKKSEYCSVIMNKFPYNSGHLLVIPNAHQGDLLALSLQESQALHEQIRHCVRILKETFQCEGINIGMNLGKSAGAGIPEHLHYHVIPRWLGDTNFFPLIAETKVVPEALEQVYEKLAPAFKKD